MSDLRAVLHTALVQQFGVDEKVLTDEAELFSDGLLDSLSVMEFVDFVQSQAGVSIPPQDIVLENFDTLPRIVRYVERLKADG
jgi:acyl carrier protein